MVPLFVNVEPELTVRLSLLVPTTELEPSVRLQRELQNSEPRPCSESPNPMITENIGDIVRLRVI